jgi:hypothetical protein
LSKCVGFYTIIYIYWWLGGLVAWWLGGLVDYLKGEIVYSFIYENWTQTLKICKLL